MLHPNSAKLASGSIWLFVQLDMERSTHFEVGPSIPWQTVSHNQRVVQDGAIILYLAQGPRRPKNCRHSQKKLENRKHKKPYENRTQIHKRPLRYP